ncbi:MAG: FHA domain-containing protein [Chloroflexota bacterium]
MAEKTYQLTERRGPKPGEIFLLTLDTMVIGRDPGATIVLNDPEVSRQHAQLTRTAEGYQLQDLGSTNGTFIDGARLAGEPRTLSPGQMITLGSNVTLFFQAIASFDPQATMVAPVEAPPAALPMEEVKPAAAPTEPIAPAEPLPPVEPPIPAVEPAADDLATSVDWPRPAELPAAEPLLGPTFADKPEPLPSHDYPLTPLPAYEPPPSASQPPPPTTPDKGTAVSGSKRNRNLIIIIAVVLLLLCCCVVAIVLAYLIIPAGTEFNFQGAMNELFYLRLALL